MTDWRRFHRAAVLFETLRAVRDGGLPIAVLVFAGALGGGLDRGDLVRACVYLGIGATVATVVGIVRWKTTLWRVTPTDIGRRSGVLSREERRVPVTRIQSVDAIRGPLQRVLGVETLQIETGVGGRHAEIVLTAVTPEEAAMLRRLAGGAVAEEPADAAAGVPVRRLRASELLLA